MKKTLWLLLALPIALTGLLSACGSPQVVYVTATPSPAPAITYVVVTSEPPTPTFTPSPSTMPEADRIPVLSPLEVSEERPGGYTTFYIKIPFSDADGDATLVDWEIVSSTGTGLQVEDGTVDASAVVQKYGTSVTGTWECGEEEYEVVLQITIGDAAGHVSAPQQVTLDCPGVEPTVTPTPSITPTPENTSTPEPTWTPWPTEPPPGPAKVRGSLPDSIPCMSIGEGACEWSYVVTFTNESGTNGTIGQIGRRYVDVNGDVWWSESGEWHDEVIVVWAHGSETYDSWVRTYGTGDPGDPDLRGGTLIVSWKGKDSLGNAFSGSVSSHLEAEP